MSDYVIYTDQGEYWFFEDGTWIHPDDKTEEPEYIDGHEANKEIWGEDEQVY